VNASPLNTIDPIRPNEIVNDQIANEVVVENRGGTYTVQRNGIEIVAPQAIVNNSNARRGQVGARPVNLNNLAPNANNLSDQQPQNDMRPPDGNTYAQIVQENNDLRTQIIDMRRGMLELSALVTELAEQRRGPAPAVHTPAYRSGATTILQHHNEPIDLRINENVRGTSRYGQFANNNNIRRDGSVPIVNTAHVDIRSANVDRNPRSVNFEARKTFLPVHKWPIKFNGDASDKRTERRDLTAFFRQVDMYARSENVSYEEIFLRSIHLFEGKARIWYIQYGHRYNNWFELQAGLKSHFETDLTRYEKTQIMHDRKQYRNESCMDYVSAMTQMFEELGMHDEKEKIAIIQNGIRDEFVMIAHAFRGRTVEELDQQLRRVELSTAIRRRSHREWKPAQKVYAAEISDENPTETDESTDVDKDNELISECAAVNDHFKSKKWSKKSSEIPRNFENKPQSERQSKTEEKEKRVSNWKCFNCLEMGHGFTDCPAPVTRIFCFRCGREGVVAPECGCRQKNA
ncbi:MAG: hypothetical protein EOP45_14750, partial [Sphingobacteriaceae bacterium]